MFSNGGLGSREKAWGSYGVASFILEVAVLMKNSDTRSWETTEAGNGGAFRFCEITIDPNQAYRD